MAQPFMGSRASILRTSRSSVPWTRSVGRLTRSPLGYRDDDTLRPLGKQGDLRRRAAPRTFLTDAFALARDLVKLSAALCILTLAACTHDRTAFDGDVALGYVK